MFEKHNLISSKIFSQNFQVWFQNRRAKFRKQERLAQQKAGEAPVKAEGKRDKPTSPAPSPHPAPIAPAPQPAHHALPHLSPPDLKPITSAGKYRKLHLNIYYFYFVVFNIKI